MGIERRQFPRYRIDMPVILHVGGGGRTLPCRSFDVSIAGVFVLTEAPVALESRVELALVDEVREETLFLAGVVVHLAPNRGIGIKLREHTSRATGGLSRLLSRLAAESSPMGASPRA